MRFTFAASDLRLEVRELLAASVSRKPYRPQVLRGSPLRPAF
jgi:hypothetical protein